jgi:hypothetical protein
MPTDGEQLIPDKFMQFRPMTAYKPVPYEGQVTSHE